MIQAESAGFEAGNYAKIIINNFQIEMQRNENGHYRGLHMVIFNPYKGVVEIAKVFDTYKSPVAFDEFI